jgi:OOP family OmpA-OmpF porin
VLCACAVANVARAQDASDPNEAKLEVQLGPDSGASANASTPMGPEDAYGPPWGTAANSVELGLFWGAFIPSAKHELYNASRFSIMYQKLEYVTPELGLRAGYYPLHWLGLELEGALMPSETRKTNASVNVYGLRGHVVLQAPTKTIVPFVLVGGGVLGIASDNSALGNDIDGAFHAGIGAKAYITGDLGLRLDFRDNIGQGYGPKKIAHNFEAQLGLAVVLGRPKPPPPPPDTDHDGVIDPDDRCPSVAGVPPLGCPPPPPDSDNDGVVDANDACPLVAGVPNTDPAKNGCPPPPPDSDGDGVPDADDKCPTVVGDGPDGCLQDTDRDGIPNRDDKCPDQPETRNGFQDLDGCPDELPEAVRKYTGVVPGIAFDTGKATIKPSSFPTLDAAAKVLSDYPDLRVEISGHTDSTGTLERNLQLSGERAAAVKGYLIGKGIASDRIETRGAGPNEPVADNSTKEGRARNRRIEFKLLQPPEPPPPPTAAPAAPQSAAPQPPPPTAAPAAPQPPPPTAAPAAPQSAAPQPPPAAAPAAPQPATPPPAR